MEKTEIIPCYAGCGESVGKVGSCPPVENLLLQCAAGGSYVLSPGQAFNPDEEPTAMNALEKRSVFSLASVYAI
ncbi:MAG: hypothetical protein V7713_13050, partial [Marinobacter sp.]